MGKNKDGAKRTKGNAKVSSIQSSDMYEIVTYDDTLHFCLYLILITSYQLLSFSHQVVLDRLIC